MQPEKQRLFCKISDIQNFIILYTSRNNSIVAGVQFQFDETPLVQSKVEETTVILVNGSWASMMENKCFGYYNRPSEM